RQRRAQRIEACIEQVERICAGGDVPVRAVGAQCGSRNVELAAADRLAQVLQPEHIPGNTQIERAQPAAQCCVRCDGPVDARGRARLRQLVEQLRLERGE